MLIKISPGRVSSRLFGEAGAVFRARPVSSLLKGRDAGRGAPRATATSGTLGAEELFGISRDRGSCELRDAGGPAPVPSSTGGTFWELLVGLAADAPSAFIPGHRSRCKN